MIDNHLPPLDLSAEISRACNLACPSCVETERRRTGQGGLMSRETWDRLLEHAATGPGSATLVGFGEPLTHPRLAAMLSQLDRLGWLYSLSTNGLLLNEAKSTELAALRGLIHLNVSVDAASPEIYRRLRGADFGQVLAGLASLSARLNSPLRRYVRYFHRLNRKLGLTPVRTSAGPWLTASVLIRKDALPGLEGLPAILAERRVEALIVQSLLNYTRQMNDQHILGDAPAAEALARLEAQCLERGLEFRPSHPNRLAWETADPDRARQRYFSPWQPDRGETRTCLQPWQTPHVDHRGDVFPCCTAQINGFEPLGNINSNRLIDIWHGQEFKTFRRNMLSGRSLPQPCRGCLQAPWGRHPVLDFSALIPPEASGCTKKGRAHLTVVNNGASAWTPQRPVSLTLINPPAGLLSQRPDNWVRPDCPVTTGARTVAPGEKVVLTFDLKNRPRGGGEVFRLEVEGLCPLVGSEVRIQAP